MFNRIARFINGTFQSIIIINKHSHVIDTLLVYGYKYLTNIGCGSIKACINIKI